MDVAYELPLALLCVTAPIAAFHFATTTRSVLSEKDTLWSRISLIRQAIPFLKRHCGRAMAVQLEQSPFPQSRFRGSHPTDAPPDGPAGGCESHSGARSRNL